MFSKAPQYLLNVPRLKETTLANGFRVASEAGSGETASVAIFVDAGSAYETSETNGVAHFLEHMTFKVRTSERVASDVVLARRARAAGARLDDGVCVCARGQHTTTKDALALHTD